MSDTRATDTETSTPASPAPATTPAPSSPTIAPDPVAAALPPAAPVTLPSLSEAVPSLPGAFSGLAGKLVAEMGPPETPETPAAALNGSEDYAQGAKKAFDAAFGTDEERGRGRIFPRPVVLVHVASPTLQTNVDGNPILQLVGREGERFYPVISDYRVAYDLSERLAQAAAVRGLQSAAKIAAHYEKNWEETHEGVSFAPEARLFGGSDGTGLGENCEVFAWLAAPSLGSVVLFLSWGSPAHEGVRTRAFVVDVAAARSLSTKLLRSAHDAIAKAQGGAMHDEVEEVPAAADPNYVPPPFASAIAQAPALVAAYKAEHAEEIAAAEEERAAWLAAHPEPEPAAPPTPDGAA